MITKNKEEIEKILKEIKEKDNSQGDLIQRTIRKYSLVSKYEERIKTSIQWCEDEIEKITNIKKAITKVDQITTDIGNDDLLTGFYETEMHREKQFLKIVNYYNDKIGELLDFVIAFYETSNERLSQLQSHLKWLKEKEKEI